MDSCLFRDYVPFREVPIHLRHTRAREVLFGPNEGARRQGGRATKTRVAARLV